MVDVTKAVKEWTNIKIDVAKAVDDWTKAVCPRCGRKTLRLRKLTPEKSVWVCDWCGYKLKR